MHSRLNIPAPAGVKAGDLHDEVVINRSNREPRRKPKRVTGSGAEKSSQLFPQSPVPQTDTGGWVEYTKARERNLSKELGINSPVTSGEGVPVARRVSVKWV